jgi:hypothetical protein
MDNEGNVRQWFHLLTLDLKKKIESIRILGWFGCYYLWVDLCYDWGWFGD